MSLGLTINSLIQSAMSSGINNIIPSIIAWWQSRGRGKVNCVEVVYQAVTVSGYASQDLSNAKASIVIEAMNSFLVEKNLYSSSSSVEVISRTDPDLNTDRKKYLGYRLQPRPLGAVSYGDFGITVTVTEVKDDSKQNIAYRRDRILKVASYKTTEEIHEFINKVYTDYVKKTFPEAAEVKSYYFEQIPNESHIVFKCYEMSKPAYTPFERIFYPGKDELLGSIKKLQDGALENLKVLLHGPPGTGKSSTIRAIATQFGYSIVYVNLKYLKNDSWLVHLFHAAEIPCYLHNLEGHGLEFKTIPIKNRIYVFEDIDAELPSITARRDFVPISPPASPRPRRSPYSDDETTEVKKAPVKSGRSFNVSSFRNQTDLTLKGLLNAFDGILKLIGPIIIMTTNHPEKLDPALIRPGRITLRLNLSKMKGADVLKLIRVYFKECPEMSFPDDMFAPCDVEAFCLVSPDLKTVLEKMECEHN